MKGRHRVVVYSRRVRFNFELRRNITVIRGDSATGKTTLVGLVRSFENLGEKSGVRLECDKRCRVLEGLDWKERLGLMKDSIVFVDEGSAFVGSEEFARAVARSDNYYVLVSRESLPNLPYSVEEVYGIRQSGRYARLGRVYNTMYGLYGAETTNRPDISAVEVVVTEDARSGYQFFSRVSRDRGVECVSARGKSKVVATLSGLEGRSVLVVADGAAFGSEMELLVRHRAYKNGSVRLYLPESFEWLLLRSGVVRDPSLGPMLDSPEDYIESRRYVSWERFFLRLLEDVTRGTDYLAYKKSKLAPYYLEERQVARVLAFMAGEMGDSVSE